MKARFVEEIGTRGLLRIYWERVEVEKTEPCNDGTCPGNVHTTSKWLGDCPSSYGKGRPGVHNAYHHLGDKVGLMRRDKSAAELFGKPSDYPDDVWPTHCESCKAEVPKDDEPTLVTLGQQGFSVTKQVFVERLYNTPSGEVEKGDVFTRYWHQPGECPWWSNCDGTHTYGVLPNGWEWDMTSRASNCTMKDDRTHRCWVMSGSIKDGTAHVGKNGHTCAAGAGSIAVDGWHGFLHNGSWITC